MASSSQYKGVRKNAGHDGNRAPEAEVENRVGALKHPPLIRRHDLRKPVLPLTPAPGGSQDAEPVESARNHPIPTDPDLSAIKAGSEMLGRAAINQTTVEEYAERIEVGDTFPPVDVFRLDGVLCLWMGFTGITPHKSLGEQKYRRLSGLAVAKTPSNSPSEPIPTTVWLAPMSISDTWLGWPCANYRD